MEVGHPPPQGPSLGSGLYCPGPSSLNRPHPPHSQAHRDFTAGRLIRDAFAVRERRGDPRVVPSFRCAFLPDMPSSPTPGSSNIARPISRCRHGLRRRLTGSTLPNIPQSDSRGAQFRGFTGSQLLRPVRLLASLVGSDRKIVPASGGFYFQAFGGSVTLTAAGYDYDIDWTPMSAGLAPAGMAASFAALARMSRRARQRRVPAICGD